MQNELQASEKRSLEHRRAERGGGPPIAGLAANGLESCSLSQQVSYCSLLVNSPSLTSLPPLCSTSASRLKSRSQLPTPCSAVTSPSLSTRVHLYGFARDSQSID